MVEQGIRDEPKPQSRCVISRQAATCANLQSDRSCLTTVCLDFPQVERAFIQPAVSLRLPRIAIVREIYSRGKKCIVGRKNTEIEVLRGVVVVSNTTPTRS